MERNKINGICAIMLLAGLLAGCASGGIGGGPSNNPDDPHKPDPVETDDEVADMLTAAAVMGDRVAALPLTSAAALPQTGSATYKGYGGLDLDMPGPDLLLHGESTLTANFDADRISGRFNRVVSGTSDADMQEFDGRIRIRGELGTAGASGFDAEISGSIDSDDYEIEADGTTVGYFRGTTGGAISLDTADGEVTFMVNGDPVPGSLVLVAEH